MKLIKYNLGSLIEQRREKYKNVHEELPIRGVSRQGFIKPKQDNLVRTLLITTCKLKSLLLTGSHTNFWRINILFKKLFRTIL